VISYVDVNVSVYVCSFVRSVLAHSRYETGLCDFNKFYEKSTIPFSIVIV